MMKPCCVFASDSCCLFADNSQIPLRLLVGPKDEARTKGDRVLLQCAVTGVPKAEVTWAREGAYHNTITSRKLRSPGREKVRIITLSRPES